MHITTITFKNKHDYDNDGIMMAVKVIVGDTLGPHGLGVRDQYIDRRNEHDHMMASRF